MAVPFPSVASRWMAALSRPPPTLQDSRRCLYRKTSSNRSRYARRIQGPRRMLTLSRLAMPATSSCRPKMSPRGRTSTRRREPKRPLLVVGPSAPSGASHKVSEIPPRAGRRLHLTNASVFTSAARARPERTQEAASASPEKLSGCRGMRVDFGGAWLCTGLYLLAKKGQRRIGARSFSPFDLAMPRREG